MARKISRQEWAWALYDWGNSAFATVVIAGLFPLFFKQYWAGEVPAVTSTFWLGLTNSGAALVIALAAPILGALADGNGRRKEWLVLFAGIGALASVALGAVSEGAWQSAAMLYGCGVIGFSGANIFYDALLRRISARDTIHRTSSLGYSLGYAGGGLIFLGAVILIRNPQIIGAQSSILIIRGSFVAVGIWWGLFSIPLMLWIKERTEKRTRMSPIALIRHSFRSIWDTVKKIRYQRNIIFFLLAYWFYIDGVGTIIRMALDYGATIGIGTSHLITALLMVQIIGFPSTLLYYRLGMRSGIKSAIIIGICGYLLVSIVAVFMSVAWHFYILAGMVGVLQGGIQALSRSFYATLIPVNEEATYFGFYNMLGRFAAIIGPFLLGVTALITDNIRFGVIPIILLFVIGLLFLHKVTVDQQSMTK